MARTLVMRDHAIAYIENDVPMWLILIIDDEERFLNIVLVCANTEEEARNSVSGKGEIVKIEQLYKLLDRARIMAGLIKELGA